MERKGKISLAWALEMSHGFATDDELRPLSKLLHLSLSLLI